MMGGQVIIQHNEGVKGAELEREFFLLRKLVEGERLKRLGANPPAAGSTGPALSDFYICSLSNKTIVYKVCYAYSSHATEGGCCGLVLMEIWNSLEQRH